MLLNLTRGAGPLPGGIYGYQEIFGGWPGNSSEAIPYLDSDITLVPWFYGSSAAEIASLNGSDAVCEGRLTPGSRAQPLRWIGAAGNNEPNVRAWAANLAASERGVGLLGTEWHFESPDLSALPATAAWAWNRNGRSAVSCEVCEQCATAEHFLQT